MANEVRVSAYMTEDEYDLLQSVKDRLDKNHGLAMSDSQAIRMAIRAWAKQEKVK